MPRDDFTISRVSRSRQEAQAWYDRLSGWYCLLAGRWEARPRRLALQNLWVKEGDRILEIGTGPGQDLPALAGAAGAGGTVAAIDLSPGMLVQARERLASAGLSNIVSLCRADGACLPFNAGSFDVLYMSFVLELFDTPEIPRVLEECRRVLGPSGRISVVSMSKSGRASLSTRLYEWAHDRFPDMVDCRPIYARRSLEAAGFEILSSSVIPLWGMPVEIITAMR